MEETEEIDEAPPTERRRSMEEEKRLEKVRALLREMRGPDEQAKVKAIERWGSTHEALRDLSLKLAEARKAMETLTALHVDAAEQERIAWMVVEKVREKMIFGHYSW